MKSINLGEKHHKIIQNEFMKSESNPQGVSRQTIHTALRYFNNSETAQAIRKRAKELLEQEVRDIII